MKTTLISEATENVKKDTSSIIKYLNLYVEKGYKDLFIIEKNQTPFYIYLNDNYLLIGENKNTILPSKKDIDIKKYHFKEFVIEQEFDPSNITETKIKNIFENFLNKENNLISDVVHNTNPVYDLSTSKGGIGTMIVDFSVGIMNDTTINSTINSRDFGQATTEQILSAMMVARFYEKDIHITKSLPLIIKEKIIFLINTKIIPYREKTIFDIIIL